VAEWQDAMSSHEFSEWMAFSQLQPFGEWRDDFRMATLAAVIVNVMTRTKESDKVHTAQDFMPDFEKALDEAKAQEDISDQERTWQKVKTIFGGLAKASKKKNVPPSPSKKR